MDPASHLSGAESAPASRRAATARAEAPAVEVIDATGAGDSFNAGFLYGLDRGPSLEAALRLAVACGSLSTRSLGGVDAQPLLDEAREISEGVPEGGRG